MKIRFGNLKVKLNIFHTTGVNLLPYSVYLQLGLWELKPTPIILQLIDRSIKKPQGIIEDVIIQVDNFYFPVTSLFLILNRWLIPQR
jgi:hypothetical protein